VNRTVAVAMLRKVPNKLPRACPRGRSELQSILPPHLTMAISSSDPRRMGGVDRSGGVQDAKRHPAGVLFQAAVTVLSIAQILGSTTLIDTAVDGHDAVEKVTSIRF
jgi:hypothetical protein